MLPLSDIQCFCSSFPFLFIYHSFQIGPNWSSTFCSEWSSFNGSNFSTEMMSFPISLYLKKKKIIPGNKEFLFALNHLIHIFNIYIYIIYIITFFRRLGTVRLIRLEQRSLSVGKSFALAKTLAGADDGVNGICSVMAEDEAGTGVDGVGGWETSATEAVGVKWDEDDDDGSWSVTPLLLQRVVPAWYLTPTLTYFCHSWSSLA